MKASPVKPFLPCLYFHQEQNAKHVSVCHFPPEGAGFDLRGHLTENIKRSLINIIITLITQSYVFVWILIYSFFRNKNNKKVNGGLPFRLMKGIAQM